MEAFGTFLPLILIFVVFYFLLIRPQQKRVKEHKLMVQNLKRGNTIVSAGGINATGVYKGNITVISGTAIDCSLGNYFTKTITGATTFTFTNVPTSCVYSMTIEITCNGSNSITWPTPNVKWPIDTAPTLTDGKTQMFTFITDDGGTRWRGNSAVDYTN